MEKIKILYDEETNLYLYPNSYNYKQLIINGNKTIITSYKNSNSIVSSIKPITIQIENIENILIHYLNANTGDIMTIDENNALRIDYDVEKNEWSNPDSEIKYRHATKDMYTQYENKTKVVNIEFIIINRPVSEYECILPFSILGDIQKVSESIFTYIPNSIKWFNEICISKGLQFEDNKYIGAQSDGSYSYPTHSNLEYAKINNTYLSIKLKNFVSRTGTYQSCIDYMNKDKQAILESVELTLKKTNIDPMSPMMKKDYYIHLDNIKNLVDKLDIKQKAYNDKYAIINLINKCLKE